MPQGELTTRIKVLATAGVMLALLLAALDQTIVGTALPRIVAELNGLDRYSWLITGYLVASTVVVPIAGKLGDLRPQAVHHRRDDRLRRRLGTVRPVPGHESADRLAYPAGSLRRHAV